ncbi:MAG: tetratricopeptide repeat protein [Tatlockia sp.]|nr:tetratricopeptide repeat protein [Tatlockia sp.]
MHHKKEPNYHISRVDELETLFPPELIKSFEEYELRNYVSTLISHQDDDLIKLHLLLKMATIDSFNEDQNFWIIKKAFEIAPFNGEKTLTKLTIAHSLNRVYNLSVDLGDVTWERYIPDNGSMLQNFLLQLRNYIPQSPFLWFYLQSSLQPIKKDGWGKLFEIYNPETYDEVIKKIHSHFVLEWLHFIPDLNSACLEYLKGNYRECLEECSKVLANEDSNENKVSENELNLTKNIFYLAYSQINKKDENLEGILGPIYGKIIKVALNEFDKHNYEKVVEIIAKVLTDPDEKKKYTMVEWNTLFGISAISYENIGETNKALNHFEAVYPQILRSNENHFGQKKIALQGIERLRVSNQSIPNQSEFFKNYTNPLVLYQAGLTLGKQRDYSKAIHLFNKALAFFIPQKGLISKECIACYSALAFAYGEQGELVDAHIKINMAYALGSQVYQTGQPDLLHIEKQLRKLDLTFSIKVYGELSLETAEAFKNLGMLYNEDGDLQKAEQAFEKASIIISKISGENSELNQELLTKISELDLSSGLTKK